MKLLLTSDGLANNKLSSAFLQTLDKPAQESKVLVVVHAQNEELFYVDQTIDELKSVGVLDIIVANMHGKVDVADLGIFDVVYVCGGNTYSILNKLRETGLDKFITKIVEAGALYLGVSAGSIIAGPSIEIAGWGSEGDKNEIGLVDLRGLGFVNLAVFPHFHEELREEVAEFRRKVPYDIVELTNDEALIVTDTSTHKI